MNSLKMSVFAIGIFLSAGTNAGGTMDSGTEIGRAHV